MVDALRDVHNKGADLYNTKKDSTGAYRMYQGALVTVRPLLGHRPDAQKIIDDGLAAAEKETNVAQKAFRLHEAIEGVRSQPEGRTGQRSPTTRRTRGEEVGRRIEGRSRQGAPVAAGGGPGFRGTVTFKGQPLPGRRSPPRQPRQAQTHRDLGRDPG